MHTPSSHRSDAASRAPLFRAYVALMILLVLTALATLLPAGPWATPVSLAIATAKLAIIFTVFMQLRTQSGLVRLAAVVGFVWLAIAGTLTFADYFTRP